jgi:hypothetical protein
VIVAGMTTMHRMRDIGISAGSAFGPRARSRKPASLFRLAMGALLGGLVVGSLVGAGWPLDTRAGTIALGGVLLAWLILSFGSERPGDG